MTNVIDVHVANLRKLGYQNLREWMNDPNHVYIGRRGVVFIDGQRFPKTDSIWHNPYKISHTQSREQVLSKYEQYLLNSPHLMEQLPQLQNKVLGCWCSNESSPEVPTCHAHILQKYI